MIRQAHTMKKIIAVVTLAAAQLLANAQEVEKAAPLPPDLDLVDEIDQPAITIRKPEERATITERRSHGIVKEIRVQTGVSTYYLFPNEPAGSAMRGDTESTQVRPALFRVHAFDIGEAKPEDQKKEQEQPLNAPALPPPPPENQ